jgi:hypothetical protein
MKEKIFKFKVSYGKETYRVMEIEGSTSLNDLAVDITDSYDFLMDHCFGFYSKTIGNVLDSEEAYELFTDQEDGVSETGAKGVEKEYVGSVFQKGKSMTFYFDYGDDWLFMVECLDVYDAESGKEYPTLLESQGALEQYPEHVHTSACAHHHH